VKPFFLSGRHNRQAGITTSKRLNEEPAQGIDWGMFVMKRAGIRLFLAACAVLLMGFGALGTDRATAQGTNDGTIGVSGTVTQCSVPIDQGGVDPDEVCTAIESIGISFTDEAGDEITYCTTEAAEVASPKAAACGINIPYGATVTVTLDESTIPEGLELYSPNPQSYTAREGQPVGVDAGPFFVITPTCCGEDGVSTDDDLIGLYGAIQYCDVSPDGNNVFDVCGPAVDVRIAFEDQNGNLIYECKTVAGKIEGGTNVGVCGTQVPLGSINYVTVDLSTTDSRYSMEGPETVEWESPDQHPDAPLSFPVFTMVLNPGEVVDVEDPSDESTTDDSQTPAVEGRTVAIYEGDCDTIGEEVAALNDVLPEDGDVVGDDKAIKAEMSNTAGALFFLDQAIDEGMAIVVYEDNTTATPIVSGELGGANTHDDMLPIGLGEVDDSGFVGTAVLSYNNTDELTTDVTIVISEALLPEPTGTPGS
jgi:hypothetical protein